MPKFYKFLAPILTFVISAANLAHGQANPNYVYYNPSQDVYRKPDMHHLAKAITAQNELAMAKLAHMGLLQAPSLNEIPVRDSVNVVMNKAMSPGDQDSGFSLPKEEKIVARTELDTEEHPAENMEAWLQDYEKKQSWVGAAKYGSSSNAESKQDSPPLTKALKTIDSKPMMRISDEYFAKKTGFAQNADSSSKTVVEKAIPTLNSKTLEPSKKLTYSRSSPTLRVPEDVFRAKLGSKRSIPKLDSKRKTKALDGSTKVEGRKRLRERVSKPKLELPQDAVKKRLSAVNPLKQNANLKKVQKSDDFIRRKPEVQKARVDPGDVIRKNLKTRDHKVTENNKNGYREKARTQKAIESDFLKIPLKVSDSASRKDSVLQKAGDSEVNKVSLKVSDSVRDKSMLPKQKASKLDTKKVPLRVRDSHPNEMSTNIKSYKNLKTLDTNKEKKVSKKLYNNKVGSVADNSRTIKEKAPEVWTNPRPLFKFASQVRAQEKPKVVAESLLTPIAAQSAVSTPSRSATLQSKSSKRSSKLMRRERKRQLIGEKSQKRQQKQISRLLEASRITSSGGNGYCPRRWHEEGTFCMRKSKHGEKFRDAVIACLISDHVAYGPGARLITVGKLRKLLKVTNFVDKFKNRAFRINAFKDHDGLWKEFPSGKVIEFWHYFPDFVPAWGHHGDTLIWLSRWNSLRVVRDTQDDHKALCYREKLGVTSHCSQPLAVECSDHGDCISGTCVCDSGFSGADCGTNSTRRSGRDAILHRNDPVTNCLSDCGPGGGCDTTTGTCVCIEGTSFNETSGSCECNTALVSGACYTFGPSGVDYVTASQYCLSRGLRMAEIHAEEDQKNIEDLLRGTKNIWLGADNMGAPEDGFRWHTGLEVKTGNLGGWAPEVHPSASEGCLTLAGVIGHTWMTMDCRLNSCCGNMPIDTLCRVY